MKNVIFLYSKDALSTESLPIYSNTYWSTPNLDELASKGTVFTNHHTAGGSTSMAFSAMLTGKNPYEFENRKRYTEVAENEKESIFSILQDQGYECHIIWSPDYLKGAYPYVKEFGDKKKTKFHIIDIYQPLGFKSHGDAPLKRDDNVLEETYNLIFTVLDSIDISDNKKVFVWFHLPHVLKGRICYGDDIDAFDRILGYIRNKFGDDSIYVTADHGHMNMHKSKVGYGHDVYDCITRVPLITPRIDSLTKYTDLSSHTDLIDILLEKPIKKHDYVLCDTAYYAQPHRKLAVITDRYKYIFNRQNGTEELYDLKWDPRENYNILAIRYYDRNRQSYITYSELYFYPYKDEAMRALDKLRAVKESIWREPSYFDDKYCRLRTTISKLKKRLTNKK